MNPDLSLLQAYPFQRLAQLKKEVVAPTKLEPILLSIGEPKHATPAFISEALLTHLHSLSRYPLTRGDDALRQSISTWITQRFDLPADSIDPDQHVLPVNGTREGLFSFAQCVIDRNRDAMVVLPNPFYQIYEGAALLAGAQPHYVNCYRENGFLADFDGVPSQVWEKCQLLYLCTPANPTGAVFDEQQLQYLIDLAEKYDFVIASDECYSEIYLDNDPPPGLLGAAARMGNIEYKRCAVFHSLSKRSNAPGLRSGFVAGDATLMKYFLKYRTYHGCAMPPPIQAASIEAWQDEQHVSENRHLYRQKFDAVLDILGLALALKRPVGAFYLWPETPIDDQKFTRDLFAQQHVMVLPGSYLSRRVNGANPGANHIRMALVASLEECKEAAERIKNFIHYL